MKSIYKAILWVAMWLSLSLFSSCSLVSVFNPDSYGEKINNVFVFADPRDLDTLLISDYGEFDGREYPMANDEDYLVEWSIDADGNKTLKITLADDIYDAAFIDKGWEMERILNGWEVTEDKLDPINGYHRIMLSNDTTD